LILESVRTGITELVISLNNDSFIDELQGTLPENIRVEQNIETQSSVSG